MSKNIVVIPAVTPKDKKLDKFGGWNWMDISKKAWKYWCKKNGHELVIYDECKREDLMKYRVTWQRWFDVHDFLEEKGIDYKKVTMVDACSIPKWDCPNFFELVGDDEMGVGIETDNLKWVYESVEGYKDLFKGFDFNINKYFCTQFVIFNKSHKPFFKKLEKFCTENIDILNELQSKVKRGTDQTLVNYLCQMDDIKLKYLPASYRLSHLNRKDMLHHNWQLKEDSTPYFIKYGKIWFFSGFAKEHRNDLMKQTWDLIGNQYE
jgi:hypothetical protein